MKMSHRLSLTFIISMLALFSMAISLSKGSTSIPFDQLLFTDNRLFQTIFLELRLPRTLSAFTTGGLLALAGTLMQLLLQNPLADPYVLGVSGGAALFTLLLIAMGFGGVFLLGGAWTGSLLIVLLMLALAKQHHWRPHTLLLSGIALAAGLSAGISFILLLSPERSLQEMLFWLAGDLSHARMPWLEIFILLVGGITCLALAPAMNVLSRGEISARTLGIHYEKYRIILYLLSSLFTAAAVTIAGCIGFIGLIIPHVTRLLAGHDHRDTLPISILLGGSLLTIADTLARTLIAPEQLPVGIVMALIGTPIFIWLLAHSQKTLTDRRHHTACHASESWHPASTPRETPVFTGMKNLTTHNLTLATKQKTICHALSITIQPGQIWGLLGPNGSGKTTLLHTLAGLRTPDTGEVQLNGQALSDLNRHTIAQNIGLLPQNLTDILPQSVWDYCKTARYPHPHHPSDNQIVMHALKCMDLLALQFDLITHLSGGERQRTAIAALLSQTPGCYLLDEPLTHLDIPHQASTLRHFHTLAANKNAAIVMSIHDIDIAAKYCTHVILLFPEATIAGDANTLLTEANLSNLYQHPLRQAQLGDSTIHHWI